jgi:hypothetical protein
VAGGQRSHPPSRFARRRVLVGGLEQDLLIEWPEGEPKATGFSLVAITRPPSTQQMVHQLEEHRVLRLGRPKAALVQQLEEALDEGNDVCSLGHGHESKPTRYGYRELLPEPAGPRLSQATAAFDPGRVA